VPADLPSAPGVYQFEDAAGSPIYVGKSVNLKRRVRGYFYGGGPDNERLRQMLRLARRVAIHRTGSDLEALLEEADRIERFRPPYNRALKNRARGWYLEVNWGDPFPRLRVVRSRRRVRAQYLGPYRGRSLPTEAARLAEKVFRVRSCPGRIRPDPDGSPCLQHGIDQCTAPCVGLVGVDAYRRQVRAAVRVLTDAGAAAETARRVETLRDAALAAGRTDEATGWEMRLGWLGDIETCRRALESPRVDRSWLVVLPGACAAEGVLLPVARGRVLPRRRMRWDEEHWAEAVRDACYRVRVEELRAESVFAPADLTPSLIVTGWMDRGAKEGTVFDLDALDTAEVVRRLGPAARRRSAA
jgi:excinuclease ABC subunit C